MNKHKLRQMIKIGMALLIALPIWPVQSAPAVHASQQPGAGAEVIPNWAASHIAELQERGVVQGYPDGTFKPHRELTRAELTAWLVRLFGNQAVQSAPSGQGAAAFTDVGSEWYAAEIREAVRLGMVTGYPDGTFRPNQSVARQEAAAMLNRVLNVEHPGSDEATGFTDWANVPAWARTHIAALAAADMITGYPDGTFGGRRPITRAESAAVANRARQWQEEHTVVPVPGGVEEEPGGATTPGTPGTPSTPSNPGTPVTPGNPGNPGNPGTPGNPGNPGNPDPDDTTPPAAPAGLRAQAGDRTVTLTWTSGTEQDLAGYRVYVSSDGGATWSSPADAGLRAEYVVTGLTNGTTYTFVVTAYDKSDNESVRSAQASAAPREQTGIGLPPNPTETATPLPVAGTPPFASTVEFLYSGDNPVQTGLDPAVIREQAAAVLKGRVTDRDGEPLTGVAVTILSNPQYGSTRSRSDGAYDMVVNGVSTLTVSFEKEGYLPVQRKVDVSPNQYVLLPDIALIPYDSKVTNVELGGSDEVQAAQGSVVTDADGTRQATLIVPAGTSGELVLPNGTRAPLPSMNFRATEYTVGDTGESAMPGDLPSFVGYTYAVELSADEAVAAGAEEVRFNQPLYLYVDNYLQFPVGEVVPIGYYDRRRAAWIPSDNGRVIGIVEIRDGLASVDADGDGVADDNSTLASLGLDEAERAKLAELYEPGDTLWRAPIEHFTPWDCNWPYGPPEGADGPPPDGPNDDRPDVDDPCIQSGSIIGCQEQSLGQTIQLPGTGVNLHYSSMRAEGYKLSSTLEIPVTPTVLPSSIEKVHLTIEVAGKSWSYAFEPEPELKHRFVWDGKDAYGRDLKGLTQYKVTVAYEYPLQYYASPSAFAQSFGQLGSGTVIGVVREIPKIELSRSWNGLVESPHEPYREAGIGGWSLTPHHLLERTSLDVYTGDGGKLRNRDADYKTELVYRVPGVPVWTNVVLAFGPDGSEYFVAEWREEGTTSGPTKRMLLRREPGGEVEVYSDVPEQANMITQLAVGGEGTVYLGEYNQGNLSSARIWKKAPDSFQWEHIAGVVGRNDYVRPVEGSDPLEADINWLDAMEASSDGTLYFLSRYNLYKIGLDGRLAQLGDSRNTLGVDEGQLSAYNLGLVDDFKIGADDVIYTLDFRWETRVRKITQDGKISLIVKSNERGVPVEHGMHVSENPDFTSLRFHVDHDGNLYFMDRGGNPTRLLKLTPGGVFYDIGVKYRAAYPFSENSIQGVSPDGSVYMQYGGGLPVTLNTQLLQRLVPDVRMSGAFSAITDGSGQWLFDFDPVSGLHRETKHTITGVRLHGFDYDADGRLIRVEDRYGSALTIERDEAGTPLAIVAADGSRTALVLNDEGRLIQVATPGGATYDLAYDEGGLLTGFTGPGGYDSSYDYDEFGLLVSAENAAGEQQTLQRTSVPGGYRITHTKADGAVYTYTVNRAEDGTRRSVNEDPNGATIISRTRADGSQTIEYPDGSSLLKELGPDPRFGLRAPVLERYVQRMPDGREIEFAETREVTLADADDPLSVTKYTVTQTQGEAIRKIVYDGAARTFTETSAEGNVTVTKVDEWGRTVEVTEDGLAPLRLAYDAQGRMTEIGQADQKWTYTYDDEAAEVTVTDTAGQTKRYAYDEAGRFTALEQVGGGRYSKQFDEAGRLSGVTLPGGDEYSLSYDSEGRLTGFESAAGSGDTVTRSYAPGGYLQEVTLPGGRSIAFDYDDGGRLEAMRDTDITRLFSYGDETNRVSQMASQQAGGGAAQTIDYAYDGADVLSAIWSGQASGSFVYEYDGSSRLRAIRTTLPDELQLHEALLNWDLDGRLIEYGGYDFKRSGPGGRISERAGGALRTNIEYDDLGRYKEIVYSLEDVTVYSEIYSYNTRGLLDNRTVKTPEGTSLYEYTYDESGQLTELIHTTADGSSRTERYDYDTNRNRTIVENGAGANYTAIYGPRNQLLSAGGKSYTFNEAGYLSGRGNDTFVYGAHGELLKAIIEGETISYAYDGVGRMVSRTDEAGTSSYLYGNPLSPLLPTVVISPDGEATVYVYDESGLLIGLERGDERYDVITDGVGTPQLVVDGEGNVVKQVTYDAFGNKIVDSAPEFELLIGFGGGLADSATGLVRLGQRDYDAVSGRWTAIDPMLFQSRQGNLYAYVNNNPVQLRDPCGLFCIGASAYAGAGGGGQLCFTSDGMSVCGELGFGAGAGLEMNPFQDLADSGLSVGASVGANIGPVGVDVGYELARSGDCFTHGVTGGANMGPLSVDFTDPANTGLQYGGMEDYLDPSVGAHAKIAGKVCGQWLW